LEFYQPSCSHLKILDVASEHVGADLTGGIRSAYLIIRGRAVLADLWSVDSSRMENDSRVQRAGWETEVTLDMTRHQQKSDDALLPQEVRCLLVCSVKNFTFILVLMAGDKPGEYKRCGVGQICDSVKFTEDCERSTKYRPGLKISKVEDLEDNVRERPVIDAWFKDIEEQEMTLCVVRDSKGFLYLEIRNSDARFIQAYRASNTQQDLYTKTLLFSPYGIRNVISVFAGRCGDGMGF